MHKLRALNAWAANPLKPTKGNIKALVDCALWCAKRDFEARLWVYTLFRARKWLAAPKLTAGCLQSEKMVSYYARARKVGLYADVVRATASRAHEVDENRDVISHVEALKLRYAETQATERCEAETLEGTLGFHPRSPVCRACPRRGSCAARLQSFMPFDIIALRDGRLTSAEARAAVYARSGKAPT